MQLKLIFALALGFYMIFMMALMLATEYGQPVHTHSGERSTFDELTPFSRNLTERPIGIDSHEIRPSPKAQAACTIPCVHGGTDVGPSQIVATMEAKRGDPIQLQNMYPYVMLPSLKSTVPLFYFSWEEYEVSRPRPLNTSELWEYDAVAVISNCGPSSHRREAITEMGKLGLNLGLFGACYSGPIPNQGDGGGRSAGGKVDFLRKTAFTLAFENTLEDGYVTEKFMHALIVGNVPVVVGAPNIRHFDPCETEWETAEHKRTDRPCVLHMPTMASVPEVVDTMKYLLQNHTAYLERVRWKYEGPSRQFLALFDTSCQHSFCRLGLKAADRLADQEWNVTTEQCILGQTHRLLVRERGRFDYHYVHVYRGTTVGAFKKAVQRVFMQKGVVPLWKGYRPDYLNSLTNLHVYKIFPIGLSMDQYLYKDFAIDTQQELETLLETQLCPRLEVIFV